MAAQLLRGIRKAILLRPAAWIDLVRATFELALANRKLRAISVSDFLAVPHDEQSEPAWEGLTDQQQRMLARVAFAIPRMGSHLPWRADCLIQAFAAKRWLACHGITSVLCIGVRKEAEFEAHAWLKVGQEIVTGGDIRSFIPLITQSSEQPADEP